MALFESVKYTKKNIIQEDDWHEKDVLARDVRLVKSGLATKEFGRKVENKLDEKVDNPEAKKKLIALTKKGWYT